ncbi:MAG: DUF4403 family protein [Pseudomonadota bacterium]
MRFAFPLFALLAAFGTGPANAVEPISTPTTISLPITIDIEDLQRIVNRAIPNPIYDKVERIPNCPRILGDKNCSLRVWARASRDVQLLSAGDGLRLRAPLDVRGQHAPPNGVTRARGAMQTDSKLTPRLLPPWRLSVEIAPAYTWVSPPVLSIARIGRVPIKGFVDPIIRQQLKGIEPTVNRELSKIRIDSLVRPLWDRLQDPIQVSQAPPVWVVFTPRTAGLAFAGAEGTTLDLDVFAEGDAYAYVGEPDAPEKTAMPVVLEAPPGDRRFRVALPVVLRAAAMRDAIASAFPAGVPVDLSETPLGGTATLSRISVDASADKGVSIGFDMTVDTRPGWLRLIDIFDFFTVTGRADFVAQPVVNADSQTVTLSSLSFDAQTDSALVDAVVAAAQLAPLREYIRSRVVIPYAAIVQAAVSRANDALNGPLIEGVALSGEVATAEVSGPSLGDGFIVLDVLATGELSAEINL